MDTTFCTLRTPRASRTAGDRGAAAVEAAFVVPLLVLFIFGIIEGGTRYAQQSQVNHYAFVAARDLAIDPAKDAAAIVDELNGSDSTVYTVTPTTDLCTSTTTESVTVVVSATKASPTGIFPDYTLRGTGVARCEN